MPSAASAVLADLLDASVSLDLVEVARTRVSVHYETGHRAAPVLCVCSPDAVRLPNSIVTAATLPSGTAAIREGRLGDATRRWSVTRWWQPPRPRGLAPPLVAPTLPEVAVAATVSPRDLVGRGPGLTPSGDDVLAGALVSAYAVDDARLPGWRAATRALLEAGRTTAVSQGMLHHALDGWAVPELAAFVTAACAGDVSAADPLLRVGHSSGKALASGALHVLATHQRVVGAA